jgi:hypothetical protein
MSKESFRPALEAWVRDALQSATQGDVMATDRQIWVNEGEGRRRQVSCPITNWSYAYFQKIRELPSWRNLEREATTWPALAAHNDTLLGSDQGMATRASLFSFSAAFLSKPNYDISGGTVILPQFDQNIFDHRFALLEQFIESNDIKFEYITILPGLTLAEGAYPCQLIPDAAIEKLTDDEMQDLGERGLIGTDLFLQNDYQWEGAPRFIFRWTRSFRKRLGGQLDAAESRKHAQEFERVMEALLVSLALAKRGIVLRGGTLVQKKDWEFGGNMISPGANNVRFNRQEDMTLSADECNRLREIFDRIYNQKAIMERSLGVALRRLSYGMERSRVEDRFLDDMISAEALFIDESSKSELRYRLSLRTAFALEPNDRTKRRAVFENMKKAYDIRSALAHGSIPKEKGITFDGTQVPLPVFVNAIEEYIRAGIHMAVMRFGERFIPDNWDDYIIGDKP